MRYTKSEDTQNVRHIRLTGVVDGSAEILTNQEDMQQKMHLLKS